MKKFSLLALALIALIPGCCKKSCKTDCCTTEATTTVVEEVVETERVSGLEGSLTDAELNK